MVLRTVQSRHRRWDTADRARHLTTVPLFAGLPPTTLQQVAERFRPRRVARGGFVFHEGEPAGTLNVLAEGRVKVIRETDEGRQVILRLINPGELFGVSGSWGEAGYPASAQPLDDAVVLQLPAGQLTALLSTHPELAMAVIRELGTRLREAESRILDLQTERVEQRIARTLRRLAGRGESVLALSRQDLADLSGTTLSTASRTLSAWHRRGIVVAAREQVTIRDLPRLERIAEGHDEP